MPAEIMAFDALGQDEMQTVLDAPIADEPRQLRCVNCRHPITSTRERVARGGRHAHRFVNPHGIPFEIGCFGDAAGCVPLGAITETYTWFPGYAWCVAMCAACGAHLGWRFQSNQDRFFGLILNQLTHSC